MQRKIKRIKEEFYDEKTFSFFIAQLFEKTFKGYDAFTFCSKHNPPFSYNIIPAKINIINALPYGWESEVSKIKSFELDKVLKAIKKKHKPWYFFIASQTKPSKDTLNVLIKSGFREEKVKTAYLPIGKYSFESIFNELFSSKVRNQCRKCFKEGVSVFLTKNNFYIKEYYRFYKNTSKNWGKSYNSYPEEFYKRLIMHDDVDFWVAALNEVFLGGIICIKYQTRIYYWASTFDRKYSKYNPINGLLYTAIKEYTNNNFEIFDFGPSPANSGVEKYKKSFGTDTAFHHYFFYKSVLYRLLYEPYLLLKKHLRK